MNSSHNEFVERDLFAFVFFRRYVVSLGDTSLSNFDDKLDSIASDIFVEHLAEFERDITTGPFLRNPITDLVYHFVVVPVLWLGVYHCCSSCVARWCVGVLVCCVALVCWCVGVLVCCVALVCWCVARRY